MTRPAEPRRLTPKGEATRNRILDAATDLIAQHGVAGTGLDDVRAAAGVSGGQLYHYFETKQALIGAITTRQADSGQPTTGALDSIEALRAWADAAIRRQLENGCRGCSLSSLAGELSASDDESRAEIAKAFLRWKRQLRDGLQAMLERGELRAEADVDELALALLSALQGGVTLSQTMLEIGPMEASLNAALAYVRSFLRR